jgi:hypothetical protein
MTIIIHEPSTTVGPEFCCPSFRRYRAQLRSRLICGEALSDFHPRRGLPFLRLIFPADLQSAGMQECRTAFQ